MKTSIYSIFITAAGETQNCPHSRFKHRIIKVRAEVQLHAFSISALDECPGRIYSEKRAPPRTHLD